MIETVEYLEFSRTHYADIAENEHKRMQWHTDGLKTAQARYDAANDIVRDIDRKIEIHRKDASSNATESMTVVFV